MINTHPTIGLYAPTSPTGPPVSKENMPIWPNETHEQYAERQRIKNKARSIWAKALRTGEVRPPERCSMCQRKPMYCKEKIQGHHPDYSRPLDVEWLCQSCHVRAHGGSFNNPHIPRDLRRPLTEHEQRWLEMDLRACAS